MHETPPGIYPVLQYGSACNLGGSYLDSSVMSQPALRCKLVHLIMKPYVDENGDGRTKLARFRRRSPYCLKELLLLSFPSDVNTIRYPTDSPRYRTAIHRLPTISHGVYGISPTSHGIPRYTTGFPRYSTASHQLPTLSYGMPCHVTVSHRPVVPLAWYVLL